MTTIAVGWDHAGVELGPEVVAELENEGHSVLSIGSDGEPIDYPDVAQMVALKVAHGAAQYGVLICGTGVGMAMAANR